MYRCRGLHVLVLLCAGCAHAALPPPPPPPPPALADLPGLLLYQDTSEIVAGPEVRARAGAEAGVGSLLARLLRDDEPNSNNWWSWWGETPPEQKRTPGLFQLGDRFVKQLALQRKRTTARRPPYSKWNTKKGRPSSGYMCYFKLCAFRTTLN